MLLNRPRESNSRPSIYVGGLRNLRRCCQGEGWLPWVLRMKIFQRLKISVDVAQSMVTALFLIEAILSESKSELMKLSTHALPLFIQWKRVDYPSQDGKAFAAIKKITITDTDHLSDSWFKTENLGRLNGADVEFVDSSTNDVEYGMVAVHLTTPSGSVVLE